MLSKESIEFIRDHASDDPVKLLLSSKKVPHSDMKLIVSAIEGRKKIAAKVPEWGERFDLCYPSSVSLEQCSSAFTAEFKQYLFKQKNVLDITGGLGVDSYYISKVAKSLVYFERNKELFDAVKYNFGRLEVVNTMFVNTEVNESNIPGVPDLEKVYTVYADPSRRGPSDSRIFNPEDYEPNMNKLMDLLLGFAERIIIKVSPMADITSLIKSFTAVCEIIIVSVFNECKEILVIIDRKNRLSPVPLEKVKIQAANFEKSEKKWKIFEWSLSEESSSGAVISTPEKGNYMYEPNSGLLKGGAFKILCNRYSIGKISLSSHLYISKIQIPDFPGRSFRIEEIYDFDKKGIKEIGLKFPKANVSTRNFNLTPPELKERLGVKDGGEIFLFGTLFSDNSRKIVVCTKAG
ncbi:MAG: hypothetical protein PHV09_00245 [Bacteroidales bacterium]|jgi:hypothetical protein|nr:hypothetical protein [Bacteroidales bacterium]MDD2280306.1 hypothetical protein [Bacteroidales bacterium]MDD4292306.1 hypothetical protein [Bacteroidales bacterium]MDD4490936.1 hypothetical protein [Bacteroidales bacterium]HNW48158.1 hypothetical protein [Bacteroidales bacterium]